MNYGLSEICLVPLPKHNKIAVLQEFEDNYRLY